MPAPRTIRLYYDDSLRTSFDARVEAYGEWSGRRSIIVDRTAFYPESGGQMADRGTLAGVAIVDVQADESGLVHHVIDPGAKPPPIGAEAHGEIDRGRRRVHMALHTAQHMLSRALVDLAQAETVSSRLGESGCTIDVDRASLAEGAVARAEDLVHDVVDEDLAIRAFFPTEAELTALPLRRAPKQSDNIRVVDIGGFDVSPCGGTHCARTAQVGLVHVTGIERYKGKMRVTFSAGRRARIELAEESATIRSLALELTCAPRDVPGAVDKLRRELAESRESTRKASALLAERMAGELRAAAEASADRNVVAVLDDVSRDFLRAIAGAICASGDLVAMLAARAPDGTHVLVCRGPDSAFDCGAFLSRAARDAGGRGGGSKERAEGRLPVEANWIALTSAILSSGDSSRSS